MKLFLRLMIVALFMLLLAPITRGQESMTFAPTQTDIDFPNSITFDSHVTSSDAEIVRAQFIYYLDRYGAPDSIAREELPIQPGRDVTLHYQWDTHDMVIVPWSPIVFRWRVIDATGAIYESEPQRVVYEDTRFSWQQRQNEHIIVLWHDKAATFGESVFDIAQKAVERQKKLFGIELAIPIHIIIYNNQDEFSAWHNLALDWVGGEAFPDLGITTQIVTAQSPDSHWLNDVIPHEISHLYLYQAAYNPTAPVPVWLNEGIAQYNEFNDEGADALALRAAKAGDLIPLTSLAAGFGQHDEARIRLAYAEGLSAVKYLVATYGEQGLTRLLAAYKNGLPTDEAFQAALGVSMGQFQQDWATWAGAAPGSMITPTPWPMPTFPPTPTPMILGSASSTPAARATSTPTPVATPTSPPKATPTPVPAPSTPFCSGLLFLLPLPLAALFIRRR